LRRSSKHIVTYYQELFNAPINMQTFEDRLLLQKRIYFLQEFGVPFEYSFGWYIRGPYSSELADDGFENESISKLSYSNWEKFSQYMPGPENNDKTALQRASKFFSDLGDCARTNKIPEDRLLELLGSLHFLTINWYRGDYAAASNRLKKLKPEFSEREIDLAQQLLEKHF
jgi:hypothetical protein